MATRLAKHRLEQSFQFPTNLSSPSQFVTQKREAINRRRFHAQGQRAERDGFGSGGFDGLQFGQGEIAFRPDPYAGAVRQTSVLLLKFLNPFAWMAALRLQRTDERQFNFFPAREKFGNRLDRKSTRLNSSH